MKWKKKTKSQSSLEKTSSTLHVNATVRSGFIWGGRVSHFQPSQRRAYAQQLVTTRLLDYLHDPARQLSRLQRIQSCARLNCNTPASSPCFDGTAVAGLLRFWAKGLFVSDWCRRKSPRSGMDSDLEAFSHYPADGSFAAMPGQTAAKTNYLKPRFLSY